MSWAISCTLPLLLIALLLLCFVFCFVFWIVSHCFYFSFWPTFRLYFFCCFVFSKFYYSPFSSLSFCCFFPNPFRQEELPRAFPLHPCLCSPKEEMRFLRCCSRLLVLCLLPLRDARSRSLRLVLVEVIATKGDLFLAQPHIRFTILLCPHEPWN